MTSNSELQGVPRGMGWTKLNTSVKMDGFSLQGAENVPRLDGHSGLAGFQATLNRAVENIANDRLMDAVPEIQMSFPVFFFPFFFVCVSPCYRTEPQQARLYANATASVQIT